jgi:hypothetical protein
MIAYGLFENAKDMLKQEKERSFEENRVMREKWQRERMMLDQKVEEMRGDVNRREDAVRRLEFEVEKAQKLG